MCFVIVWSWKSIIWGALGVVYIGMGGSGCLGVIGGGFECYVMVWRSLGGMGWFIWWYRVVLGGLGGINKTKT